MLVILKYSSSGSQRNQYLGKYKTTEYTAVKEHLMLYTSTRLEQVSLLTTCKPRENPMHISLWYHTMYQQGLDKIISNGPSRSLEFTHLMFHLQQQ